MNNFLEEGGRRIEREKEMQVSYTGIFYSAKSLLENRGQLVKNFHLFRHRVLDHVAHFRRQEVRVKISAGENLAKANKISIYIQGVGLLEVRKRGNWGEEDFRGRYSEEGSGWGVNLESDSALERLAIPGYLEALEEIRKG